MALCATVAPDHQEVGMQPFGINAQGTLDDLEQRLADAADAVADHAEATDDQREELHALAGIARQVAGSPAFGDSVREFSVSITGGLAGNSSTSGGLDTLGVSVVALIRETATPSDGETTGQVDPAPVGTPDSPPATPNQN